MGGTDGMWYLPHFSTSQVKFHIVYDGAAQFIGTSLNDHILPGPDMLTSFFLCCHISAWGSMLLMQTCGSASFRWEFRKSKEISSDWCGSKMMTCKMDKSKHGVSKYMLGHSVESVYSNSCHTSGGKREQNECIENDYHASPAEYVQWQLNQKFGLEMKILLSISWNVRTICRLWIHHHKLVRK